MNDHTHSAYDRQIEEINSTLSLMAEKVQGMNTLALEALQTRNANRVEEARATDKQINEMERLIEQRATEVIALRNPMAVDLRFMTSAIKIAGCLERVADLAKHVVKQVPYVQELELDEELAAMEKMSLAGNEMLSQAIAAFHAHNADAATQVWAQDDVVDELCDQLFVHLSQRIQRTPELNDALLRVMFASKDFERMADYAAKIAKIVHYVASGETPSKATLRASL